MLKVNCGKYDDKQRRGDWEIEVPTSAKGALNLLIRSAYDDKAPISFAAGEIEDLVKQAKPLLKPGGTVTYRHYDLTKLTHEDRVIG